MKNKTFILGFAILLIIVGVGILLVRPASRESNEQPPVAANEPAASPEAATPGASGISVQGSGVQNLIIRPVITRTDSGFQPAQTTVKKGAAVVFRNDSSEDMWPASAVHPSHTAYSGTSLAEHCPDAENVSFDACRGYAPGENWEFTFNEAGTWGFHDHLHPQFTGKVIVTE